MDGKFLAFAGPHDVRRQQDGYFTLTPDDYIPHFKRWGVQLVVRLNKKYYDENRFIRAGMEHMHMYYLDGSTPTNELLQRFLRRAEATDGPIAVHCKAGLGRTGTCIGAYLMKHFRLTAAETIAWLRICRPGSVIGPQQQFLEALQPQMWAEGDAARGLAAARRSPAVRPADPESSREAAGAHASSPLRASDRLAARLADSLQLRSSPASPAGSVASDTSQGDHLRGAKQRSPMASDARASPKTASRSPLIRTLMGRS